MNKSHFIFVLVLFAVVACVAAVQRAECQTNDVAQPNTVYGQVKGTPVATNTPANMDAEREQIWNSANMLRARAWLKDYCSKSAKITPEMAKDYEAELANMTPKQMKLYLMKFDEEEQQRQQQYAAFQQANEAGLKLAMAAHRQTQQAYSAINQATTQSAMNAQQQIDEQRDQAQSAAENKELNQTGPYPNGYGYGNGYGPYGLPAYGGIHYHYHLYAH